MQQREPSEQDEQQDQEQWLTYGLIFGPALGMLASIIFAFDLALGLVFGAALGMLAGLIVQSIRQS